MEGLRARRACVCVCARACDDPMCVRGVGGAEREREREREREMLLRCWCVLLLRWRCCERA